MTMYGAEDEQRAAAVFAAVTAANSIYLSTFSEIDDECDKDQPDAQRIRHAMLRGLEAAGKEWDITVPKREEEAALDEVLVAGVTIEVWSDPRGYYIRDYHATKTALGIAVDAVKTALSDRKHCVIRVEKIEN